MSSKYIPLRKALLIVFLSTLLISGSITVASFYYLNLRSSWAQSDQYKIVAMIQTSEEKEALKTVYLSELLELSVDKPVNIYRFNTDIAVKKIMQSPVIKSASVELRNSGIIYVDYSLRRPIAYLYDFKNAAFDNEGVVFPVTPFFTPKNLPEVYLGNLKKISWGKALKEKSAMLAINLLKELSLPSYREAFNILRIDLSNIFSDSSGQRQIVLLIEEHVPGKNIGIRRILRLNSRDYVRGMEKYLELRKFFTQEQAKETYTNLSQEGGEEMIIDLRISQLAFIKK